MPTGKLIVVDVIQREPINEHNAYATVICQDEKGVEWEFNVVAYARLMQPHTSEKKDD